MNEKFQKIWELALPYLKKGKRKDFVIHTSGVVRAMELLLLSEMGDPDILIPAAILHDTGWSKVSEKYQKTNVKADVLVGMKLHLEKSAPIIEKILSKLDYDGEFIKTITEIVLAHKFVDNPDSLEKILLIDADTLSDVFKEQFYRDCAEYGLSPSKMFEIRKNNRFHLESARNIFEQELSKRKSEIGNLMIE